MSEAKDDKKESPNISSSPWTKLKTKSKIKARMGHAICTDPKTNKIYIFGGECHITREGNDLWELTLNKDNPSKSTYKTLGISSNHQPNKRIYSNLGYYNNNLYLFFGKGRKHTLSTIEIFNINKKSWNLLNIDKCRLTGCSISQYNEYFIIFGGSDHNDKAQNDIWLFNCNKNILECLANKKIIKKKDNDNDLTNVDIPVIPQKRKHHTSCIIAGFLIVHGGGSNQYASSNKFGDFWYTNIKDVISKKPLKWTKIEGIEIYLNHHSMISYNDKLIIYGGKDDSGKTVNNLYIFNGIKSEKDLKNLKNLKKEIKINKGPDARFSHACSVAGGYMCLFGGKGKKLLDDTWFFKL